MKNLFYKKMIIEGIDYNMLKLLFEKIDHREIFFGAKGFYLTDNGCMMVTKPQPIILLPYYKFRLRKINKHFHKNYKIRICKGLHF